MTSRLPLADLRVIELAGLAPGPFCGLLLADYGASVLRIDGPRSPRGDVLARGKSSICLDLKQRLAKSLLLDLVCRADVLIDPFRPGVLERLGLSPTEVLLKRNPRLIVARLTGFRRDDKYRDMAGHDINYLAVSGVLSMLGRANEPPYAPGNILGDFAGGGAMCLLGILLAWIARQSSGKGQVIEANMVDGAAYLATFPRLTANTPFWGSPRGHNILDGGCPWYTTYETRDQGKYFAVGALEPPFYEQLVQGLGLNSSDLPSRDERKNWPALESIFKEKFRERTRAEWEAVFDGKDACATPVLAQSELASGGFEQRLPITSSITPEAAKISHDDGGWTGGMINKGHRGEETLQDWMGWTKHVDYIEDAHGYLTALPTAKL